MKKKQKRMLNLMVCMMLLVMVVLPGCGNKKVTAESLMEEVNANTGKAESFSANMKLEMKMDIKSGGMNMDFDISGDFALEATNEPLASHTKGTVSMSFMGISYDTESFTVIEDGKAVTYTNSMDTWTKTETDIPDQNQMGALESVVNSDIEYTLQEELEKVEGKDVYVLTSKISGDLMNQIVDSMSDSMDEMTSGMDWSKFSADITLKIDKASKMPVEVFMDCTEGMAKLMESVPSEDGEEITVNNYTLTISYTGFNNVESIVVPDEAKTASEAGNLDSDNELNDLFGGEEDGISDEDQSITPEGPEANADGSYTIKPFYGEGSVNIGVPAGYEISPFSDETYLSFTDTANEDFDDVYITYTLLTDYTEEELVSQYMDNIGYYEEDDDYGQMEVQDVKKVQTSKGEAGYIKVSYVYDEDGYYVEYFAYMFLDENLVLECSIEESAYQEPCKLVDEATIMETVFSVVTAQ